MAKGTIYGSTNDQYISARIEWESTPNYDTNTSTVTASLYYKRTNEKYITGGTGEFSIRLGDKKESVTKRVVLTHTTWLLAVSLTHTVSHNEDGTCSIIIGGSGSIPGTTLSETYCNQRVTLDTIPRAATISAAYSTALGSNCKIVWTPRSTAFYYKVRFALGTFSYITEAFCPGITSAYTYTGYTIPLDVATNFPNAKIGTMTATLYTYSDNGITQVGSESSMSFKVDIPENDSTKPSISMTISPVTPYEKFSSLYLQGISKVKATFGGEGKYGATIVAYSLQAQGGRYAEPNASNEYISNVLTQSGEATIVGYISDSRGFGNNTSQKINVIAYETPYISPSIANNRVICERCDEDGIAKDDGTYLRIKGKRNYTKIDTDGIVNHCSVSCRYKAEGGTWSEPRAVLPYTNTETDDFDVVFGNMVIDKTRAYTVELKIVDDTNIPSVMVFNIPSEDVTFSLRRGGGGAAFGKYANTKDLFECVWDAKFHKGISINNEEVLDFVVEQGSTDIWHYRKWYSGRAECWGRRSITVDISTQWGTVFYGTVEECAFPSGLFTDAPICQVTAEFGSLQAAWTAISGKTTKDSAPSVMFCGALAELGAEYDILYYAFGDWK